MSIIDLREDHMLLSGYQDQRAYLTKLFKITATGLVRLKPCKHCADCRRPSRKQSRVINLHALTTPVNMGGGEPSGLNHTDRRVRLVEKAQGLPPERGVGIG